MNYEGLLDEIFGINTTFMQVKTDIIHTEMPELREGETLKEEETL